MDQAKRDKRALLSGLDLIQAEHWLATRERDFDADDAAFIHESAAARDAERAATARLRRRLVQRGTAFAAIAMNAILSAFAIWGWSEADRREKETAEMLGELSRSPRACGRDEALASTKPDLERGASEGNEKAMAYLGVLYINGIGVPQDFAKPASGLMKGRRKRGRGCDVLAWRLYSNGRGVPQDYAKAREWYEKAAKRQ